MAVESRARICSVRREAASSSRCLRWTPGGLASPRRPWESYDLPAALVFSVSGLRRQAARGAQGQAAFEVAVSYAQQRQAFGSPIASLQAIQLKLSCEILTEF